MRIWLITSSETTPMMDASQRLMKTGALTAALARKGHDVTWWVSNFDHITKAPLLPGGGEINWAGARVRLLEASAYKENISFSRILSHRSAARSFRALAPLDPVPDVIYASLPTLELAQVAVQYGQENSCPVVVDVRDLWPDEFEAHVPNFLRPLARILTWPMSRQRDAALRDAYAVTGVSPTYLAWALKNGPRNPSELDRVFYLGYPEPKESKRDIQLIKSLEGAGVDFSKKLALFVGTFNRSIDFDVVLRAGAILANRDDLQIVLCGDGFMAGEVKKKVQAAKQSNIVLTGWQDHNGIQALLKSAYVGIAPYRMKTRVSLPNKLFEYLSEGVPIANGLSGGDASHILAAANCGMDYVPGNAASLADVLARYLDDPVTRDMHSDNAREFFKAECSQGMVLDKIASYLQEVARHYTKRKLA